MSLLVGWARGASGDAVEDLCATVLIAHFKGAARRVTPGRGDGGVDVIHETPDSDEIWQVKKYAVGMTSSEFGKVRNSWRRFCETYGLAPDGSQHPGTASKRVLRYWLVTPWTPTEKWTAEFRTLTAGAAFPCQWQGAEYLQGMDGFAEQLDFAIHGTGVLERNVAMKAMLARNSVESADTLTALDAVGVQQEALNVIRDSLDRYYRIDSGTRTTVDGSIPWPAPGDAGVMHRVWSRGGGQWAYESVVPRNADAHVMDPISVMMSVTVVPGTEGHAAFQDWVKFGTPLQDVESIVEVRGGPFAHGPRDVLSSILPVEQTWPSLMLQGEDANGAVTFCWVLETIEWTSGFEGGMRGVLETPQRTLRVEIRAEEGRQAEIKVTSLDAAGRAVAPVAAEAGALAALADQGTLRLRSPEGESMVSWAASFPADLAGAVLPVSELLASLSAVSDVPLVMPPMGNVRVGEIDALRRVVSVVGGETLIDRWTRLAVPAPTDSDEFENFKASLTAVVRGEMGLGQIWPVIVTLGGRTYPLNVQVRMCARSVRLPAGTDVRDIRPGDQVLLVPGDDDAMTTELHEA